MRWQKDFSTDSVQHITRYAVKNFFRDKAIISINSDISSQENISLNDTNSKAALQATQTQECTVNIQTGLLESRKIHMTVHGEMDMDSSKIPIVSKVEITEHTD